METPATTSVVRMVPIVPGMRYSRKRSSSTPTTATNSVADDTDSASTANDSMRPVVADRTSKRRRTILDAFNSISLQTTSSSSPTSVPTEAQVLLVNPYLQDHNPSQQQQQQKPMYDDANSSQAVAEDDGGYTTNSSLEEEEEDEEEGQEDVGADDQILSDSEVMKKVVERKVMLELVFGPDSTFVPHKNPVDRKVDRLIRNSLQQAAKGAPTIFETQDDMSLATAYNSTISSDSDLTAGAVELKRSNSLPEMYNYSEMDMVSEEMDTEDE